MDFNYRDWINSKRDYEIDRGFVILRLIGCVFLLMPSIFIISRCLSFFFELNTTVWIVTVIFGIISVLCLAFVVPYTGSLISGAVIGVAVYFILGIFPLPNIAINITAIIIGVYVFLIDLGASS